MSAVARARYPYNLPEQDLTRVLLWPAICTKKLEVAIIAMYGKLVAGASEEERANAAPGAAANAAFDRMSRRATDMQLEFPRLTTPDCEVEVREADVAELVPTIASGARGSKSTDNTTKTSRSSGDKLRSICPSVKVFAADSSTSNPIETMLLVDLRPVGISVWKVNSVINLGPTY